VSVGSVCIIYKFNHQTKPISSANPAVIARLNPNPNQNPILLPPTIAPATKPAPRPETATANLPARVQEPVTDHAILASATTTVPSNGSLQTAQDDLQAGHLIAARDRFNDLLQSGNLSAANTQLVKQSLSQISQTTVFSRQTFAHDSFESAYLVKSGDSLSKIGEAHNVAWQFVGRINNIDAKHLRAGATIKVIEGPFFAVVNKRQFLMDIYLGGLPGDKNSMYVTSYPVGLGQDDSTPLGTWIIQPDHKVRNPTYYSPRGEGVIAADDPKNPLGGYWIGLTGTDGDAVGKMSYGIHGTIEPDSIGKQSSMGCIRLRADDIAMVFDLMVEGKSLVKVQE
jgi:lipoprotein-anchoring transpeptidase ErfK/SrfK